MPGEVVRILGRLLNRRKEGKKTVLSAEFTRSRRLLLLQVLGATERHEGEQLSRSPEGQKVSK